MGVGGILLQIFEVRGDTEIEMADFKLDQVMDKMLNWTDRSSVKLKEDQMSVSYCQIPL